MVEYNRSSINICFNYTQCSYNANPEHGIETFNLFLIIICNYHFT